MFFADVEGFTLCKKAQQQMQALDVLCTSKSIHRPYHALTTDVPATEEEIRNANEHEMSDSESFLDYLKKTCVWCSRSGGDEDRSALEFLARSQGIWLHALQYSLQGPNKRDMCYSTPLPEWSLPYKF